MQKSDLRVFPRPNGTWVMKRDGGSRPLSTYDTKRAALGAGRIKAMRDGVDLTVQHRCGWVTDGGAHLLDELARQQPMDDLLLVMRDRLISAVGR